MKTVAVIDYQAGNLRSISQAFRKLNSKPMITSSGECIESADYVVLPGVGAFSCISNLIGLKKEICKAIGKKPFLGICLGLQALFEDSEEARDKGLGIFGGKVTKLRGRVKIPHIGWNTVQVSKESELFNGVKSDAYFYFVHSYAVEPLDKKIIASRTNYGSNFVSSIEKDNVFGTQFHPEKSGENGLRVLENFLEL